MEGEENRRRVPHPYASVHFAPNDAFSYELVFEGEAKYLVEHAVLKHPLCLTPNPCHYKLLGVSLVCLEGVLNFQNLTRPHFISYLFQFPTKNKMSQNILLETGLSGPRKFLLVDLYMVNLQSSFFTFCLYSVCYIFCIFCSLKSKAVWAQLFEGRLALTHG